MAVALSRAAALLALLLACGGPGGASGSGGAKAPLAMPGMQESSSLGKTFSSAVTRAQEEQSCEDFNSLKRAEGVFERRFLVMPMSDELDPPAGHPGHGRLQYCDRIMVPASLARDVMVAKLDYPFQFELAPLGGAPASPLATSACKKLLCGLVWQRVSPENFIFMPKWMMRALGLKPRDVVTLKHLKLPPASLVKFRPVKKMLLTQPRAVLENELKHYSTVTKGSTVAFHYNDKVYEMVVEGVKAGREGDVDGASIEDTDVSTELLESVEEVEEKKRKAAKEARAAMAKAATKAAKDAGAKGGDKNKGSGWKRRKQEKAAGDK
mmetsp:Transcript_20765/g.63156  ORF Transcript_20765/g.63156 Transcript_20765/m.63156 type:complete len:324 (-) Transcript_20765:49-1020(-)